MSELKRFQPRLAKTQSAPLDFERASVALLAKYKLKPQRQSRSAVEICSEWRDPLWFEKIRLAA